MGPVEKDERSGRQNTSPEWINALLKVTILNNTGYIFKTNEEFVREAETMNAVNKES